MTISFILFALPAGLLGNRYGKKPIIFLGLIGMSLLFFGSYFFVRNTFTLIFVLVCTGIFWSSVNVNSLPLVYHYGDEKHIGAYTGLYYFSTQLAAVLGPTIGGVLVDLLQNNYRILFVFSATLMLLSLLFISKLMQQENQKP